MAERRRSDRLDIGEGNVEPALEQRVDLGAEHDRLRSAW
jgi:hypothetical protein